MPLALMLLLACTPERVEVESWLGTYTAGPETIAFAWEGCLIYKHGNIAIPVDGEWHLSVPEFHVRHRVTWIEERRAFRLEESHDASPAWRHEFRRDGDRLLKVSLDGGKGGGEVVVRVFDREDEES